MTLYDVLISLLWMVVLMIALVQYSDETAKVLAILGMIALTRRP